MIKKRSKFFTFCLALFPGAGHMYLGFMKLGLFFMLLFFGTIFLSTVIFEEIILFLLPVIYIYSFFDAMNKVSLSNDEFYLLDDYFPILENNSAGILPFLQRNKVWLGIGAVIIGINLFFRVVLSILSSIFFLPPFIREFFNALGYRVPQLFFAFLIVYLGLKLIAGKRNSLHNDSYDYLEEERKKNQNNEL